MTLVLSKSKERVVLPLFFFTLFGSHWYIILGLRWGSNCQPFNNQLDALTTSPRSILIKASNCRFYVKWLWSWARARSGSCSHYFSWRYLAVIDTRFLACAHYQGEASRPLLPPLENVLTSHTDSFHETQRNILSHSFKNLQKIIIA